MTNNPQIGFASASMAEVPTLASYLGSLSSPIDSFLEDHIVASAFGRVLMWGADIGHFAIHEQHLLTQFHLVGSARRHGPQVLAQLRQMYPITAAFVPTCDEFFLSHAVEDYVRLEKQACFFVEADPSAPLPPIREGLVYRAAQNDDLAAIERVCGDFIDKYAERIAGNQLHVGYLHGEFVALGVIERSKLFPGQASIGMFTSEEHRGLGIGTSTISYMRGVCRDEGLRPIAGCWYYNHLSRKTLEAAGLSTPTRLLRFEW